MACANLFVNVEGNAMAKDLDLDSLELAIVLAIERDDSNLLLAAIRLYFCQLRDRTCSVVTYH